MGVIALAYILFDGGLSTEWHTIRPVFSKGLALSTLGVLVTAVSVGMFATLVLDFSLLEGMLLGSIISSTDAAAVFSILRSRDVQLKGQLEPLLELESGSNDPMAVFLTIGITQLILSLPVHYSI
jgi:potassium/hydrogen antiporter